jgi:AraC-like DNA-binding protein
MGEPLAHLNKPLGWLDARGSQATPSLADWAAEAVRLVWLPNEVSWRFSNLVAKVRGIAVEFDTPQARDLLKFSDLLAWNARLPVVMFSEYHAEDLAVWAFRTGVVDYIVKPLSRPELIEILLCLSKIDTQPRRGVMKVHPPVLPALHDGMPPTRSAPAVSYIRRNLHKPLLAGQMAEICGLSVNEFSRVFHRENNYSFRSFVLQHRMEKAASLLSTQCTPVADVAHQVGIGDPSLFSRYFRRFFASTPTEFRQSKRS